MSSQDPSQRDSNVATFVGLAITVAGFLLIGLAWNGAAEVDWVPAQFPYLISGGLTGLGLIILGVTVILVQAMRQDAAARARELVRLVDRVDELHRHLAPADDFDPAVAGEFRPRPRVGGNGEAHTEQLETASSSGWERPE